MAVELSPTAWLASGLLHVGVFAWLAAGPRMPAEPEPRPPIEMTVASAEVPAPPPPPPVAAPTTPLPEPAPQAPPSPPSSRPLPTSEPARADTREEPVLDMTGTTLATDRGAFALPSGTPGGGSGAGRGTAKAGLPAAPTPSPGLVLTSKESLSRLPTPPDLTGRLLSKYPPRARSLGDTGSATLSVVILPDGRTGLIDIRNATAADFGEACKDTVSGSLWSPPLDKSGMAVATRVSYTCRFDVN